MNGQMSIFDFMQPETESRSLDEIPEVEMIQMIHNATGLDFKYRDELFGYQAKMGGRVYSCRYSNYDGSVHGGARHIACGWDSKNQGCGAPRDSVEDAIDFFKRALKGVKDGK